MPFFYILFVLGLGKHTWNGHLNQFNIIIIILIWEFFTSAFADDFPLESEWQQVSSSLQDFSQYSDRYQQCCSLDHLHSSSYFQILQSLNKSFGDCTKRTWLSFMVYQT